MAPSPPSSSPSSSQDVAHAGAWTQQHTPTDSTTPKEFVLKEHPDVGTVGGRNIGEILQEYKPRGKDTAPGNEISGEGIAKQEGDGSSSMCVEDGSEKSTWKGMVGLKVNIVCDGSV
jgi:hypothetical protein